MSNPLLQVYVCVCVCFVESSFLFGVGVIVLEGYKGMEKLIWTTIFWQKKKRKQDQFIYSVYIYA